MNEKNLFIVVGLCVAINFFPFSLAQSGTPNCGGNISATSYDVVLTSPGYPGNHRHNLKCKWTIFPTILRRSIKLTLTDLDTEECCDYIEIYGGKTYLGRFSGTLSRSIPIVTTQTNMTIIFVSDSSIARSGFRATYKEVNNCGQRLNATNTVGHFSTPHYPHPHPPYLDCYWIISAADPTQKVQVTIEAGRTQSCCDYVEVFHQDKSLGRLKGNISSRVFKGLRQLNVYFHSDGANSFDGFRASYKKYVCGGTFDLSNDAVQTVTSPNYPNRTEHNLNCVYNFIASPGYRIEMTLTVDTEPCCDYVQLYEGSKSLDRLQGSLPKSTIITSGRQLRLVYRTDGSVASKGFTATYRRFLPRCNYHYIATETPKKLQSPGYPALYPNNYRCDWTIHTQSGSQIALTILNFVTEACCDRVELFDGPISIGKLQGKIDKTFSIVTQRNSLRIQFNSDNSVQKKGFQFRYKQAANCGDKIEASAVQKRISTPHYPTHKYENNMDCMWILEALPGQEISLNISKGETEKVVDYIQILDGLNPIARLSGLLTPQKFISKTNVFRVYFHSDDIITRDGFTASFQQICTETFNVTQQIQFLSSPNYPSRSPHNFNCSYFLNARNNQRIQITVKDFQTESCCDIVKIYDGQREVKKLSGTPEVGGIFYSTRNNMRVVYTTDGTHSSRGFRFAFKLVGE